MADKVSASSRETTRTAAKATWGLLDSTLAAPAAVDAPRAVRLVAEKLIMRRKQSRRSDLPREPAEEGLRKVWLLSVLGAVTEGAAFGEPRRARPRMRGEPWRKLQQSSLQQRMRWRREASRWLEPMAWARYAKMVSTRPAIIDVGSVSCVGSVSSASCGSSGSSRHGSSPSGLVATERGQRSGAADSSCAPTSVGYASLPALSWSVAATLPSLPGASSLWKPPSGALSWLGGGSLSSSERLATCGRQMMRTQAGARPAR